jgi:hypothetical protein
MYKILKTLNPGEIRTDDLLLPICDTMGFFRDSAFHVYVQFLGKRSMYKLNFYFTKPHQHLFKSIHVRENILVLSIFVCFPLLENYCTNFFTLNGHFGAFFSTFLSDFFLL